MSLDMVQQYYYTQTVNHTQNPAVRRKNVHVTYIVLELNFIQNEKT